MSHYLSKNKREPRQLAGKNEGGSSTIRNYEDNSFERKEKRSSESDEVEKEETGDRKNNVEKAPEGLVMDEEEQRLKTDEKVRPPMRRKRKLSGGEGEK